MGEKRNNLYRALIVDDERLARVKLRAMLAAHPEIEIAGEADSATAALALIETAAPDVVFLDIQMPGGSGFDLIDRLSQPVKIIFVTAFDQHAIRAFEVGAIDYLLKPLSPERLAAAIARLTAQPAIAGAAGRLLDYDDALFIGAGEDHRFLRIHAIACIQAADNYSEVYCADQQKLLVHKSLGEWEQRLPEKHFARIHRATIINLNFVERIEPWFNGAYNVYLRGLASPLTMSRRYSARLKTRMS